MASVAIDLEAQPGAASMAQEQSRVRAKKGADDQPIRNTRNIDTTSSAASDRH